MLPFRTTIFAVLVVLLCATVCRAQDRVMAYEIVDARAIPESLTGADGNAEAGRKLYFDRQVTGCSGCHGSPGGPGAQPNASGPLAPTLSGIAGRMDVGTIRLWLVAPQVLKSDGEMPSYYEVGQRDDEDDPLYGSTRLSAREIEDLVAYLALQETFD